MRDGRSNPRTILLTLVALTSWILLAACRGAGAQPEQLGLPSWANGPARQAITRFVGDVTRKGGPLFVPPAERIAVFDNDGTLWNEHPVYTQAAFIHDRVRAIVAARPELRQQAVYKAVLDYDLHALAAAGEKGIVEIMAGALTGMTTDEFDATVRQWLAEARHPRFGRPYTELVYQPQLELLAYLREHGFKIYIVSGGGADFMRPWTEGVYGIPPEQVIGSTIKTTFQITGNGPALLRLPEIDHVDDHGGKPVSIHRFIGRRPILAFGNSDGDLEMLQYTDAGKGPRLLLLLHHDDADREYAYDRSTRVGTLDRAWDEAVTRGWTVVSMKRDFRVVFPPPPVKSPS